MSNPQHPTRETHDDPTRWPDDPSRWPLDADGRHAAPDTPRAPDTPATHDSDDPHPANPPHPPRPSKSGRDGNPPKGGRGGERGRRRAHGKREPTPEAGPESADLEAERRVPTVIADEVHIVYTVNGPRGGKGSATAALHRMLRREKDESTRGMRRVHAVRGISFTAYRGEAIGVIGTNGSGKSTLLKAVAGLLPTESGRVYTGGQPSLLGVNAALMNDLTGERNVMLGGLAMGMTPAQVRERYQQIVDFSGIDEKGSFSTLPMRTYSSGMAARLRFSIAAARQHDVLIIDEALATGDRRFQKRSEQRVQELRREAGTVFLVSHSNKTIRETCDRVLWLEKGVLQMDGPTEDVLTAYDEATGK